MRRPDESLYYQERGVGEPLVLAHGFTSVGEDWAEVLDTLAERYRVVVPDLRGHGRSTGAVNTITLDRFGTDPLVLRLPTPLAAALERDASLVRTGLMRLERTAGPS